MDHKFGQSFQVSGLRILFMYFFFTITYNQSAREAEGNPIMKTLFPGKNAVEGMVKRAVVSLNPTIKTPWVRRATRGHLI